MKHTNVSAEESRLSHAVRDPEFIGLALLFLIVVLGSLV